MLTMYDSVDLTQIPAGAAAVAGYVNGRWPTFTQVPEKFPKALHLSIAVSAEADADCLDIEQYDATPAQAPEWVRRQNARGVARPALYCSLSEAQNVLGVLAAAGIKRDSVRLFTAHYTGTPHLCSKSCGFEFSSYADATQYTDKALGRSLDASLVSSGFFTVPVSPATRRARLRAWILAQHRKHVSWWAIFKTVQWKLFRRLGGK